MQEDVIDEEDSIFARLKFLCVRIHTTIYIRLSYVLKMETFKSSCFFKANFQLNFFIKIQGAFSIFLANKKAHENLRWVFFMGFPEKMTKNTPKMVKKIRWVLILLKMSKNPPYSNNYSEIFSKRWVFLR